MKAAPYRAGLAAILLTTAALLSGCAMITEMANTPSDSYDHDYSAPADPYYRGHSSDASAPGIR